MQHLGGFTIPGSPLRSTPSPTQLTAIALLLAGRNYTQAARGAGVDRATLYRWLNHDAAFKAELEAAKREQVDAARAEVGKLALQAVKTLADLMEQRSCISTRLRAAMVVLRGVGVLGGAHATNADEN